MMETAIPSVLFLASVLCASVSPHVLRDVSVNNSYSVFQSSILFPPLPITVVGSTNEQCRKDSQTLLENLRNSTTWAMQMLDASAKGADGVLFGSSFQFGDFYECIETVHPIQAHYCIVSLTIEPPDNIKPSNNADVFYNPLGSVWNKIWHTGDRVRIPRNTIKRALCVPASCSHTDVQASIRRHLDASPSNLTISVAVNPSLCQTNRAEEAMSGGSIVYCIVMATILLVVAVSTFCDQNVYSNEAEQEKKPKNKNANEYVSMFSLKRNLHGLLKPSKSNLGCMNGMKFISTFIIIFSHRGLLQIVSTNLNYEHFEMMKLMLHMGFILQVETVVDSFFVISGILVTYGSLSALKRNAAANPILSIIPRYLRLTPVYAVIVFFYATVMYHCGSGPLWTAIIGREREFCQENWWTNLLYVNNYVNDGRMCMVHSWYMGPEFQLYVIATFLILLIHKCPKLGYSVLGLMLVASVLTPFIVSLLGHIDPVQFSNEDLATLERVQPYFQRMYTKTHVHATPYLVGIVAGLLFYRQKLQETRNTKWQSSILLVVGCLLCVGTLIPGAFIMSHIWKYNDIEGAMVQAQRRLLWSMGVAVILYSLAISKESVINKILSCRAMAVLSRLCYSAYLVSMCIQLLMTARIITPNQDHGLFYVKDAFWDFSLTFLAAFVLYLTVEAPFSHLLSRFMKQERQEPRSKA